MDCNKVCNKVIILTVSAIRKTSHIRQIDRLIMLTLINLPKIKTKAVVLRSPRCRYSFTMFVHLFAIYFRAPSRGHGLKPAGLAPLCFTNSTITTFDRQVPYGEEKLREETSVNLRSNLTDL